MYSLLLLYTFHHLYTGKLHLESGRHLTMECGFVIHLAFSIINSFGWIGLVV